MIYVEYINSRWNILKQFKIDLRKGKYYKSQDEYLGNYRVK